MHIAAAVGTPLIALFGSTEPVATGPFGVPESVIHKRPACSPCYKRKCPLEKFTCMEEISVEEVVAKVRAQLEKEDRV
jgi:heptosyltransferase-2